MLMGLDKEQGLAVLSHVFMDNVPLRVYRHGSNTIPRKGWAAGDACSRAIQLNMLVQPDSQALHPYLLRLNGVSMTPFGAASPSSFP